jgi:hypothetical protein
VLGCGGCCLAGCCLLACWVLKLCWLVVTGWLGGIFCCLPPAPAFYLPLLPRSCQLSLLLPPLPCSCPFPCAAAAPCSSYLAPTRCGLAPRSKGVHAPTQLTASHQGCASRLTGWLSLPVVPLRVRQLWRKHASAAPLPHTAAPHSRYNSISLGLRSWAGRRQPAAQAVSPCQAVFRLFAGGGGGGGSPAAACPSLTAIPLFCCHPSTLCISGIVQYAQQPTASCNKRARGVKLGSCAPEEHHHSTTPRWRRVTSRPPTTTASRRQFDLS